MDESNSKFLTPELGDESSSFDTANDNSQEERVLTVKKRKEGREEKRRGISRIDQGPMTLMVKTPPQ